MNKLIITIIFLFISLLAFTQEIEMANLMRSNGKIYVVVAVVLILFLGLFFYLFKIDKKVSELEKEIKQK